MMMITKMTKISLFVLAGMISGSSAHDHDEDWCRKFDNKPEACFDQHGELCIWIETDKLSCTKLGYHSVCLKCSLECLRIDKLTPWT